jgi:type III secretion protein F
MAQALDNSSSVTINAINDTIYAAVSAREMDLRNEINNLQKDSDGNVSQTDLLLLQQKIATWSLMIDIQSTITKSLSDSLKSVVQKSS